MCACVVYGVCVCVCERECIRLCECVCVCLVYVDRMRAVPSQRFGRSCVQILDHKIQIYVMHICYRGIHVSVQGKYYRIGGAG